MRPAAGQTRCGANFGSYKMALSKHAVTVWKEVALSFIERVLVARTPSSTAMDIGFTVVQSDYNDTELRLHLP